MHIRRSRIAGRRGPENRGCALSGRAYLTFECGPRNVRLMQGDAQAFNCKGGRTELAAPDGGSDPLEERARKKLRRGVRSGEVALRIEVAIVESCECRFQRLACKADI